MVGGIRYGHTCAGHAVGAAAALATLDVWEKDDLIARAAGLGERLRDRLAGLAGRGAVVDVRGVGLVVVVEMATPQAAASAMDRDQQVGLLIRRQGPEGRSLLLAPPLILDAEGADAMAERLGAGAGLNLFDSFSCRMLPMRCHIWQSWTGRGRPARTPGRAAGRNPPTAFPHPFTVLAQGGIAWPS